MQDTHVYHFKINRKQRSIFFIRLGLACFAYIAGLYVYEHYTGELVAENFRSIYIYAFGFFGLILFYISWWHLKNPATYEATVTRKTFTIVYPDSAQWSFDIKISDIDRFEHRQPYSSGGKGIAQSGVVMKNGDFHEIVMNYGNKINKMYEAIKTVNPEVSFSKKVAKNY